MRHARLNHEQYVRERVAADDRVPLLKLTLMIATAMHRAFACAANDASRMAQ
jgi:hypothetical protein